MVRRTAHYHKYKGVRQFDYTRGKDTCLRAWRECACGAGHWVKKRRPKNVSDDVCLWFMSPCADHPNKRTMTRREFFDWIHEDAREEEERARQDRPATVS